MWRRWSAGETRHRQIKATPEKVHWTAFAAETRPEFLKHAIALHEDAPEPAGVFAVIRVVFFISIERDRILNLVRHCVDGHRQIQILKSLHQDPIKLGNRTRFQFDRVPNAVACLDAQFVIDKIKIYLERAHTVRDR